MKYLIATIIILGSIIIYQIKSNRFESTARGFLSSIINSSKSSYCLAETREMETAAREKFKIYEANPGGQLLISEMKNDLKTYEENLKENGCEEITKKYLKPNALKEFSEKSAFLKDQYDFYAVASGESYILVKLRRVFGVN